METVIVVVAHVIFSFDNSHYNNYSFRNPGDSILLIHQTIHSQEALIWSSDTSDTYDFRGGPVPLIYRYYPRTRTARPSNRQFNNRYRWPHIFIYSNPKSKLNVLMLKFKNF